MKKACCGIHWTDRPSGHCDWTCCEHEPAAPDPLRDRLQALCDAAMRNNWHLGAEAVSVTVAQVLAVVGEGS